MAGLNEVAKKVSSKRLALIASFLGLGMVALGASVASANTDVELQGTCTASNRAYDGTAIANGTFVFTLKTPTSSASFELLSYDVAFASKNVGSTLVITAARFNNPPPSGYDLPDFPIALAGNSDFTNCSAQILAKDLTVSGAVAQDRVYNGRTNATVDTSLASLVGVVTGDNVSLDKDLVVGTFDSKNVGDNKSVTTTGFAISGADSGNYTISPQPTLTADVTRAPAPTVTVSGSKTYGDTSGFSVSAQLSGTVNSESTSNFTLSYGGGDSSTADVGSYTITADPLADGDFDPNNYLAITQGSGNFEVNKKSVTISGITATTRTYNGTNSVDIDSSSASISGIINSDVVTLDVNRPTTGTASSADVGNNISVSANGSFGLSGTDAFNYELTSQPSVADVSITPKALTFSGALVSQDRTYDTSVSVSLLSGDLALDGVISPDDVGIDLTSAVGTASSENAGTRSVTVSGVTLNGNDKNNYSLTGQPNASSVDIARKVVTVLDLSAVTREYDGTQTVSINDDSASLSGVISGDIVTYVDNSITTGTADSKNAGTNISVSTTAGTLSGAEASNYQLGQSSAGTVTISPKSLSISGSLSADSKTYDSSPTVDLNIDTLSLSGFIGSETVVVDLSGATGTASDEHHGTRSVTVTGVQLSNGTNGGLASNYTWTAPTSAGNVTISKRDLVISNVVAVNRVYNTGTTITLDIGNETTDKVSGDLVNVDASNAKATVATKVAGLGRNASVSSYDITGEDAENYNLLPVGDVSVDIYRAPLTLSIQSCDDKQYDGSTTATCQLVSNTLFGVLANDLVNINTSSIGFDFIDQNVGTNKGIVISNAPLSQADASNYDLVSSYDSNGDITPRLLNIQGVLASDRAYDGTTVITLDASTYDVDRGNVVGGDVVALDLSSASGVVASKDVADGKNVTLSGFTLSGDQAGNYSLNLSTSLTVDITRASLTITPDNDSKTYGELHTLDGSAGFQVAGMAPGETISSVTLSSAGTLADAAAATYDITAAFPVAGPNTDLSNYIVDASPKGTLTVNKKALTITADDDSKNVGQLVSLGAGQTTGYQAVGLLTGQSIASITLTSSGAAEVAPAGTYNIVPSLAVAGSGTDLNNYSIQFVNGTLTVNALPSSGGSGGGGIVLPAAPTNSSLPVITGTNRAGNSLVVSIGAWVGTDLTYTYQWYVCDSEPAAVSTAASVLVDCTVIAGATAASYQVAVSNSGKYFVASVTATTGTVSTTAYSQFVSPDEFTTGYWTKRVGDNVKIYAKNFIGLGKVQFFVNGREIAWATPLSIADTKLRVIATGPQAGDSYLVRDRDLVDGRNFFEIKLNGVVVESRVAYKR